MKPLFDPDRISQEPYDPLTAFVRLLREEPDCNGIDSDLIDHLLAAASFRGASDISILSNAQVHIQIRGRVYLGTKRILRPHEVSAILAKLAQSENAESTLSRCGVLTFTYDVRFDTSNRRRYRITAASVTVDGMKGIEISARSLPLNTPTFDSVQMEDELRDHLDPQSGIIMVAGPAGHGKSTTMAAITRSQLENKQRPRKIIDLQSPIEFTYRDVLDNNPAATSFILQSEVNEGLNLPSFGGAIRASLHRTPHIIGVGECRDSDTLSACITASSLGITVNTTMPARSVAEVLGHMVRLFPASEQASRACDLIRSLRVIMTQQLVSQPDFSGQLAVREFIVFNDEIRDRFASSHFDNWTRVTDRIFKDARNNRKLIAQSFIQAIETRIRKGLLTRDAADQSSGSTFCQTR